MYDAPRTAIALIVSFLLHVLLLVNLSGMAGGREGPLKMPGLLTVDLVCLGSRGARADVAPEPTPFPAETPEVETTPEAETPPALSSERAEGVQPLPDRERQPSPDKSSGEKTRVQPGEPEGATRPTPGVVPEPKLAPAPGATAAAPEPESPTERVEPQCADCPGPGYPELALRRGLSGSVTLEVQVLPDGGVGDIFVSRSSGFPSLDEAALQRVKTWTFYPATENGEPVSSRITRTVRFELRAP